jgi:transposase
MFIRQTQTNNSATGERYVTYRLVRGERIGGKVRQITLLNLGRNFSIHQEDWPLLCLRMEQLMLGQETLLPVACSEQIEQAAQRYVGQLIVRSPRQVPQPMVETAGESVPAAVGDIREVDVDSLTLSQPRSVGVEQLALHAVSQLGLMAKLTELGINGVMRAAIMGNLIGRMAKPASELATWNWLQTESGLGELIDVDFNGMSHMSLYRASDLLMRHRTAIEDHVFGAAQRLFGLEETITLFDLTNTYFEGQATANLKAKHGRSKEKRSDCPLVTLGLVLDENGFVRRSKSFAGNVAEGSTLEVMLTGLAASRGALVIMDAGIATKDNLDWLVLHEYRYIVVRRGGERHFDAARAIAIETACGETVRLHKEVSEDGKEVLLHCHSSGRQAKEEAMVAKLEQRFVAGLQKMADGLTKTRSEKRQDKLLERIGRLKERSGGISQHYEVTLATGETGKTVTQITWEKKPVVGTMDTHPGVYCLRSSEVDWEEERLWRTYTMLTDLESVFRSLKSELGLRPVYHQKEERCDGHLFITVLAYQCVQTLRRQLGAAGINDSWASLRQLLSVQRRVTTSMNCKDGRTLHIRKSTTAEPALKKIYQVLRVNDLPGGTKKMMG